VRNAKLTLEIEEVVAEALECGVMPSCVAAAGVLTQEVDHGCKGAEEVLRADVEFEGVLGHAFSMHAGDKNTLKKR
jgi:hypothetical protein